MLETKSLPGIGRKYTFASNSITIRMLFLRPRMWRLKVAYLNNPQFKELSLFFCTITIVIYK